MKKGFLGLVLIGAVILVMGIPVFGQNSSGVSGVVSASAANQEVALSFADGGSVAIFEVSVTGLGILSVDVADYNPSSYADYWRGTIVVWQKQGPNFNYVQNVAVTNVGYPGTTGGDYYGAYAGRTSMVVNGVYKYLVIINYEKGADTFSAGMKVRFSFNGTSMTVTQRSGL